MSRINDCWAGEASRDNIQAKIAIAQGGWFGQGPGNSIQRNFIASPYADFIFAIICEESGIIGGMCVLLLSALWLFPCSTLMPRSPSAFGDFHACGVSVGNIF